MYIYLYIYVYIFIYIYIYICIFIYIYIYIYMRVQVRIYLFTLRFFFSRFPSKEKRFWQSSGWTTVENVYIPFYFIFITVYSVNERWVTCILSISLLCEKTPGRYTGTFWFYVTLLENDGGNETQRVWITKNEK